MEITLMGYVLIPLGVFLLFFKMQYLFMLSIFFSGFTNSGVIKFEDAGFTLMAPMFLFAILIFKYFFHIINKKTLVKPDITLSLFILICALSLVMPSILSSQNIEVIHVDGILTELKFTTNNITQFMYIFFSFLVYWLSKDILWNDPSKLEKYMNAYFLGALAICLLGYYQVLTFNFGLPFDEIFRDSLLGNSQIGRVYSVTMEPSALAFYTAPSLALLLFYKTEHFFMPKVLLAIMLLILGFLSTSTSFFVGVFLFVLFLIYRNMLKIHYTKENISTIKKFLFFHVHNNTHFNTHFNTFDYV